MAYSTQANLESAGIITTQLVQLTDDNGDGVADAAVIAAVIAQADAEIDGYLGTRYTVPVSPVPALVVQLSTAIAAWRLYGRRSLSNDHRSKDYDDAVATLKRLARGEMVLPAVGGGEVATDGADLPQASRTAEDRTFTLGRSSVGDPGTLDGF
jgi:phage gp36-like protein